MRVPGHRIGMMQVVREHPQAHHRQELVDALAYWAASHLDLQPTDGARPAARAGRDPEPALRRLHAAAASRRGFAAAVQGAARDSAFGPAVAMLVPDARLLQRLSLLAAQAYAASGAPMIYGAVKRYLDERERARKAMTE